MNKNEKTIISIATVFTSILSATIMLQAYSVYRQTSILNIVGLIVVLLLSKPLKWIYLNAEEIEEKTSEFFTENKNTIILTSVVFTLSTASFTLGLSNQILDLVNISFSASARIFSQLQYFNPPLTLIGELVYQFARTYMHLAWIYVLTDSMIQTVSRILNYTLDFAM